MFIPVIGAGSIGRRHHENLTLLGVRTALLPWRGFDPTAFRRLGADAVVIATATPVRLEPLRLAADLGLPIYLEKPLGADPDMVEDLLRLAEPQAHRSMLGLMMRYHPAYRHLARSDLTSIYDFSFAIGHDVRRWRQNWRFSESYAADPKGGGVLLDLCHELDMALSLFPDAAANSVTCLGHPSFPGVDFATRIGLSGPARQGAVAMDYLSAVSFRRILLRGTAVTVEFDMIAGRYSIDHGQGAQTLDFPFQRNDMFLAAMSDFRQLVAGEPVSDVEHLPRLDRAAASARATAQAWRARRFTGKIAGDYA